MLISIKQTLRTIITSNYFAVSLFIIGGVIRLIYCFQAPVYTTDLLRNLGYGVAFEQCGFKIYDLTPFNLSPLDSQFLWQNHRYTYPAMTPLFFALVSKIWASLFFGKLVLVLLDVASTWLMYRMTKDIWSALFFWLYPVSIWFGAHEGQFEGYVNFLTVCAFYFLHQRKSYAYAFLSFAIQAKLFPVFLCPYFLTKMSWKNPARLVAEMGWGIAGFIPSLIAVYYSGYLGELFNPGYVPTYNPISWSIGDPGLAPYAPVWLVLGHAVTSLIFLIVGLFGMKKTERFWDFFGVMFMVVFAKSTKIGQHWYFMVIPAFCLSIEDQTWRRRMLFAAACICIKSLYSMFIGLIDYQNSPDIMMVLELNFWGF